MKEVIFLIILMGALGGIYYYNATHGLGCDGIKDTIFQKLEEINTCEIDSDCVLESRYDCPFGCYQVYNKNTWKEDLKFLDDKYSQYKNSCEKNEQCVYDCVSITKEDVKCIDKKCMIKTQR